MNRIINKMNEKTMAHKSNYTLMPLLICALLLNICWANRYDYLLFSNNYRDVRKGVDLGADVNSRLRGSTPLYDASRKNNMDILYLLLRRGARVNDISHGETPLHKVVQFNNYKFAQVLLKAGANPNIQDTIRGNTALHYAVSSRNSQMISLLMDYGANMNIENNARDTPARYILSNVNVPAMQAQNSDILIQSSGFYVGSGSVSVIVKNLTNNFITVVYGSLYMNGDLVSEQSFNKKIPPKSAISIGSLPVSREAYQHISIKKSGIAHIKYGFGIEYDNGKGGQQSLYKSTKVDVKIW